MDILIGMFLAVALSVGAAILVRRRRARVAASRPRPPATPSFPPLPKWGPVALTYRDEVSALPRLWPTREVLELRDACEAGLGTMRSMRAMLMQRGFDGLLPSDEALHPRFPLVSAPKAEWEAFHLWIEQWNFYLSGALERAAPAANNTGAEDIHVVFDTDAEEDSAPASSAGSRK